MRVLYITNGMASTLNSSFELSRRLVTGGHEVSYASPAEVGEQVAAQGYPFRRLEADRSFIEKAGAPVPLTRPLPFLRSLARRRAVRRESIANNEIEQLVEELDPDLLLIDVEMHFAILVTAAARLPTLLPIVWFSVFRQAGLPPMHTALAPGRGWRSRLRIALSWLRLRLQTINGEWQDRLHRTLRGDIFRPVGYETFNVDDLRAVAASRGFPFTRETDRSHWLRPYAYSRFPILCFNAREMELPQKPWPTVHYVGPMVHLGRREALADSGAFERWRRFAAQRDPQRPLVYCSLGTFWSMDQRFLRQVVEIFQRRQEWDLVLGLGGKLEPDALAPIPENVLVLDYAPQLEVLAASDCAITHGGITTINECIELGVPMLVYSTKHVDQNGCAVRVEHHSLGVVGDKDRDDGETMERNLERALNDPEIRSNVEAMRARFRQYKKPDLAVETIEKHHRDFAST